MKIAVIGGTGLLGSNLVKLYSSFDVKAFSRNHSTNIEEHKNILIDFDLLQEELNREFKAWKPDIVINTVAIVNLQKCEDDYHLAVNVNCRIAKEIAEVAKSFNSYFIHISTDHYFNDLKEKHNENDEVLLFNNYAKSKYLAEQEVSKVNADSLIVRTNIIGFRNSEVKSFFEWLIDSLRGEDNLHLFTNFFTSPIAVNELGEILLKCYDKHLTGVFNIGSCEVINKYRFGIKAALKFDMETKNINKSEIIIEKAPLKRALTLGLDVSKIEKKLGVKMPTVDETLDVLYTEYKERG